MINQSIVSACEGQKAAAFSGDSATHDNWAKVQQTQIVKLQQLEELMVGQENATVPAATPAPVLAETQPAAVAEASPKPARKKKDAGLQKADENRKRRARSAGGN